MIITQNIRFLKKSYIFAISQFKKINKIHNKENINNCVSIDEISFVLNSKPSNGWFKKDDVNEIQINNKKIISERYSLLVASTNEKIILFKMCIVIK